MKSRNITERVRNILIEEASMHNPAAIQCRLPDTTADRWTFGWENLRSDVETCNDYWRLEVPDTPLYMGRFFRKAVSRLKRFIADLVDWKLARLVDTQNIHNAAITRSVNELTAFVHDTIGIVDMLASTLQAHTTAQLDIADGLEQVTRSLKEFDTRLGEHVSRQQDREQRLADRVTELSTEIEGLVSIARSQQQNHEHYFARTDARIESVRDELLALATRIDRPTSMYNLDYSAFQDTFRGQSDIVGERFRQYLTHFRERELVLDLGCGRGEMLDVLRESNIRAIGVDTNDDMITVCASKGLEVVKSDVLEFVQNQPSGTFDGVFLAHVVEHLEFDYLVDLCRAIGSKIATGGIVVIETPNPKSLSILRDSFVIDPTHRKPVHPNLMRYLLEVAGMVFVEVLELNKPDRLLETEAMRDDVAAAKNVSLLNDVLFSGQDYAMIATKA